MRFIIILFLSLPLYAFSASIDCLNKAKLTAVIYERAWIKKNESANAEEIKSVRVAKDDDGKDSTWSEHNPSADRFGIFVESKKTEDNTHWEFLMNPKTCAEVIKAERKTAP